MAAAPTSPTPTIDVGQRVEVLVASRLVEGVVERVEWRSSFSGCNHRVSVSIDGVDATIAVNPGQLRPI